MIAPADLRAALETAKAQLAQGASAARPTDAASGGSFANVLGGMIDQVSQAQNQAQALAREYQLGNPAVGIEETMIAMNKASLSFQMLVQVRNQVVKAYTDTLNMPL